MSRWLHDRTLAIAFSLKMLMMFEELDGALVFLCGGFALEGSEISALAGFRILLSRIQAVFP
ncbi:MAG TPA: hypothetical protein VF490_16575 [Chryseosolibacter sp.]